MTTYSDDWTGGFVAKAASNHEAVDGVEQIATNRIRATRAPELFGESVVEFVTVDVPMVDVEVVDAILTANPGVDAIVVVKKTSHYSGDAKETARSHGVGLFTMRELMGALGSHDFANYERSGLAFVKKAVAQHSRVSEVFQVDEELLSVDRYGQSDLTLVTADVYVMGVADVRDLLARFPTIDAIVKTNPNGEYSDEAKNAAKEAGVGLFTFGELMGALNFDGQDFLDYVPKGDR